MDRRSSETKREALREQGALHGFPQRVVDPLFEDSEFFDPQDAVQVKYEMLRRVREDGMTITEAAKAFGFSRPSFYKARSDFESGGLPGLIASKRGPQGPHKLTEEVLAFLADLRAEAPCLSSPTLADQVLQQFGKSIHPRSIERALPGAKKKRL